MTERRKLIEVALPLEAINRESAREKSIRHGHPSTLHLWWARRPLAAARAVLFAQLVDDPSSNPELSEEEVALERKRLFTLLERLVVWENTTDEALLEEARAVIRESCGGTPPPVLDPFAGGGTIPLEAQRLGLEAHASDLNPVAVLINKALIEIPPRFAGQPPVFPGAAEERLGDWPRATGLAEDVRRYGKWMRDEAEKRIGHLYPKATLSDGSQATVIAWIWARTVTCPNPGCGIEMPLVRSWWLGKKKGKEAYVVPRVSDGRVSYSIGHDVATAPTAKEDGTVGRTGARCIGCETSVPLTYVRAEGKAGRIGSHLIATVAEGRRTRHYLAPNDVMRDAADIVRTETPPAGMIPLQALSFRVRAYGFTEYSDLFTNRQLAALTTFSDLVSEARERVLTDGRSTGIPEGDRLTEGGDGAAGYADAVATYLGLGCSRMTDIHNALATWSSSRDQTRNLFARQAIPMAWDFVEACPFATASGSLHVVCDSIANALQRVPAHRMGRAISRSAENSEFDETAVSTDPPYYDNIGYSDLSDFFYVWLRRSLKSIHPDLFSTILVPKAEELVANPYRHGGKDAAQQFFQEGFEAVFQRARSHALPDFPITVYYAFKQQESALGGESSTGWETLLEGMIRSGWQITATWPMRSERSGRMLSVGTNALASSIVLALRPRPDDAPRTDRRGFISALRRELPVKLRELQQGSIAPVDVPQAVIGPGMTVFTRYSGVLEDDGSRMSVRTALQRINAILDEVLSEQIGDFGAGARFALEWFRQYGFGPGLFGDAESIANARGVSLDALHRAGILVSGGGRVRLLAPADLPTDYDPATDPSIDEWEVVMHLARTIEDGGVQAAAVLLGKVPPTVDRDLCRELAGLLFKLAGDRKLTAHAVTFNTLGAAWHDIIAAAPDATEQLTL